MKPPKGTLSADVASHADTPLMHFVTGISFGVTVYNLGIQFANSDWTDRINSFVQNRQVWVDCAKLVVFFHALVSHLEFLKCRTCVQQSENLGYFLMYRYLMEIATIFECPM